MTKRFCPVSSGCRPGIGSGVFFAPLLRGYSPSRSVIPPLLSYPCARVVPMYSERASALPHVVAWWSVTPPGAPPKRILPDGCLDIIWRDGTVFVAGPDTTAQLGRPAPG